MKRLIETLKLAGMMLLILSVIIPILSLISVWLDKLGDNASLIFSASLAFILLIVVAYKLSKTEENESQG
jgi:NADH:ubiquinone oxidoreductase subunit 3 (subunit A)